MVLASILMFTAPWLASEESNPLQVDEILARYDSEGAPGELNIHYPFDEAVFPPEIRPPTFVWEDSNNPSDAWLVRIRFSDGMDTISVESPTPYWTPSDSQWQTVQSRSVDGAAEVTVLGVCRAQHDRVLSSASISIQTSDDEVGAPIFYREVNLPFRDAVNEPSKIRWRFGEVASRETPPVVLEKLPVCGNCHSFSADGKTMGMDVDYANDKGSYAILPVDKEMVLEPSKIITWSDFKRQDGEDTFGLLSRVSPDGRYVVSTVKDGSVFLPRPDIAFSQLFFPIKGILAVYSRDDGTIHPLPGADDPQYVQSNGVWSPDGKWIVFARSKRYRMEGTGLLKPEECKVFTEGGEKFLFDLYRIPFNDGRGGDPEPLAGASQNGMSNYFPRYSPDGKWIVFCKAKSYMLLQPDSELYIIPSSGGEARRLRCNTNCMNSWHSFSPNGRWMVFSSKVFSPYTQLFLTHFDDAGHSSPPVLLRHFTTDGYAANIPEFVHADDRAIERIRERFVNDYSYVRQAQTNVQFEDLQLAEASCRKALALNPQNASATFRLGAVLVDLGRSSEAAECFRETIKLEPDLFEAHLALGIQSMNLNQNRAAIDALREAVRLRSQYAPARYYLALALQREGDFEQALTQFERILEIDPDSAPALSQAAFVRATCPDKQLRDYAAAIRMAERACELTGHNDPEFLATLARVYLEVGRRADALATARRASEVARRHGREDFARRVERDFAD
ncbi:MAG: tetratricopeptide repeat protein [Planctomycetes bacterium]|nr:tetratricopeptide repeat protein [Planctomycetota bacterium]